MSRPLDNRIVSEPPLLTGYKAMGAKRQDLEQTQLTNDESEAFRLAHFILQGKWLVIGVAVLISGMISSGTRIVVICSK